MALAEMYVNSKYTLGGLTRRFWMGPRILVGGSVSSVEDYEHLKKDFGVSYVLSVESEHTDYAEVPMPFLHYSPFPDVGTPPPVDQLRGMLTFAKMALNNPPFAPQVGRALYVHCQAGGSRSPSIGRMVAMGALGVTSDDSMKFIHEVIPGYGSHPYHQAYMTACDAALREP